MVSVAAHGYWLISTVTCLALILAKSSEQKRVYQAKQEQLENKKAYTAAVENSTPHHDAGLNALLDSLGDQLPEDKA